MTTTAQIVLDIPALKEMYRTACLDEETCREVLNERSDALSAAIKALNKEFEESNAELLDTYKSRVENLTATEERLRNAVVDYYKETGNKSFDENLSVQVRTKLVYDNAAAVAWAEANATIFIQKSVDKKAFEKIAEGLDFVTTEQSVSAVIKGLK